MNKGKSSCFTRNCGPVGQGTASQPICHGRIPKKKLFQEGGGCIDKTSSCGGIVAGLNWKRKSGWWGGLPCGSHFPPIFCVNLQISYGGIFIWGKFHMKKLYGEHFIRRKHISPHSKTRHPPTCRCLIMNLYVNNTIS